MNFSVDEQAADEQAAADFTAFKVDFIAGNEPQAENDGVPEASGANSSTAGADDASNEYDFDINLNDIPESPQISGEVAGETNNETDQNNTVSPELLRTIVDELSTIKAELNKLKTEISTIRNDTPAAASVSGETHIYKSSLSSDETLSTAELDAIISNADISIDDGKPEMPPEADISPAEGGAATFENMPQDVSVDLDLSGGEMPEDDALGVGQDFSESTIDSEPPEQNIVVPSLNEEENANYDDQSAMPAGMVFADTELPDTQPEMPPPIAPVAKPVPVAKPPEAIQHPAPEPKTPVSAPKVPVSAPKVPVSAPPAHATDIKPPAQSAEPQQDDQDDTVNSTHFKKDLQVVLSYMDRLLEALPDEKIEEFARSKQFDVYKKVFKELGLV
jgi:hypothetical protein